MKVKEENEKAGLKLNIQKTKIMASGPITSWQINRETMETVTEFGGGSKITADGDCSHEIKRCLLLGRKVMTSLDSIFKSGDITSNKSPSSQGYGFSSGHVWMWELDYKESWAPKNWCFWTGAWWSWTDAFELWCYRRVLRVPWTARRSNQSILKESTMNIHWKDYCWSWSFNTLATWCKDTTHWKRPWCLERLKAKREGGGRDWDDSIASLTQWTWIWANSVR